MYKQHLLLILITGMLFACNAQNQSTSNTQQMADSTSKIPHKYYSRTDFTPLKLSETEWKEILSPDLFTIARLKGTEYAFTGKYWDFEGIGSYFCAACGNALFKSDAKFASSCGWPSFYEALRPQSVRYEKDNTHGMMRIEVLCGRCDSHLGHIFDDGPAPTFKRFCMNSVSLDFEPDSSKK